MNDTDEPGADADEWALANAAGAWLTRHERGEPGALAKAGQAALRALPVAVDPDVLRLLAKVLLYEATEGTGMLADAERIARQATEAAEPDHPELPVALGTLAIVRYEQFLTDRDTDAVRQAVDLGLRAIELPAEDAGDRVTIVINLLGHALAKQKHAQATLDRLITLSANTLGTLPVSDPDWALLAGNHALLLSRRAGSLTDKDTAIALLRRVVAADGVPGPLRARRLANLAALLADRSDSTGAVGDHDESVELFRIAGALSEGTDTDQIDLELATALSARHDRLGDRRDLLEAVKILRQDVPDDGDRALMLGRALRDLYRLTGDAGMLAEAVDVARTAAEDPGGSPVRLVGLADVLNSVPTLGRDEAAEAVAVARRAATLAPELAAARSALGLALVRWHEHSADHTVLSEASAQMAQAIRLTRDGTPDHAMYRANLALVLLSRHEATGRRRYRRAALDHYRAVAATTVCPPDIRQDAARNQGYLALGTRRTGEGAAALDLAVRLQAEVAPERLDRADVQRLLSDARGLVTDAAAMAIVCGRDTRAACLLELGRGVLLRRTIGLRTDTGRVRRHAPDLAAEFDRVRDRVDTAGLMSVAQQAQAVADLHDVVRRIRAVESLRGFLRPPRVADLTKTASHGPVVMVNVSSLRCDALVLLRAGVARIPLPALDVVDVVDHVRRVHDDEVTEAELAETLDWLWGVLVKPVLDRLAPVLTAEDRLWWVPTGALALLPVHAATSASTGESALDRIVSSYTPTVSALRHVRRPERSRGTNGKPVVLHATYPEGTRPLPRARKEADWVARHLATDDLDVTARSTTAVLETLSTASGAHLALHAVADLNDPAAGGVALPGGLLTVADVAATRLADPGLCYLSACETSLTSMVFADEAIHLTAAFLLAGFRSVVGTFWPVRDAVAWHGTRSFYAALAEAPSDTAGAVHRSTLHLRNRYPATPSVWAALHHMGR